MQQMNKCIQLVVCLLHWSYCITLNLLTQILRFLPGYYNFKTWHVEIPVVTSISTVSVINNSSMSIDIFQDQCQVHYLFYHLFKSHLQKTRDFSPRRTEVAPDQP